MTLLREFFRTLKSRNRLLRATLVTGITRFARAGLWSGMHHLRDVSLRPDLATLCGFTQTELQGHPVICATIQAGAKMLGCSLTRCTLCWRTTTTGIVLPTTRKPSTTPIPCLLSGRHDNKQPADWPELPNYWVESGTSGLLLDFSPATPLCLARSIHPQAPPKWKEPCLTWRIPILMCLCINLAT